MKTKVLPCEVFRIEGIINASVLSIISNLSLFIIFGAFGNRWYYQHTRHKIIKLRSKGLKGETFRNALIEKGRTSGVAVWY